MATASNDDIGRVRKLIATLQRMQKTQRTPERAGQIRELQQALARRTGAFRNHRAKVSRRKKRQHKPRA